MKLKNVGSLSKECGLMEGYEILNDRDKFRINTFFRLSLMNCKQNYKNVAQLMINLFGFSTRLNVIYDNLLKQSVNNLVKVYPRNLEANLYDELKRFIPMVQVRENKKSSDHVKNVC